MANYSKEVSVVAEVTKSINDLNTLLAGIQHVIYDTIESLKEELDGGADIDRKVDVTDALLKLSLKYQDLSSKQVALLISLERSVVYGGVLKEMVSNKVKENKGTSTKVAHRGGVSDIIH